jgi:hypothetical protein
VPGPLPVGYRGAGRVVRVGMPDADDFDALPGRPGVRREEVVGIELISVPGTFTVEIARLYHLPGLDAVTRALAEQQAAGFPRIPGAHQGLESGAQRRRQVNAAAAARVCLRWSHRHVCLPIRL